MDTFSMELQFLGATGTVTGSKYLLRHGGRKILIDCGLFQGLKELRLRNWADLPVPPGDIDAVILTHAHIDHSGYVPLLVRNGFKGPVYCSDGPWSWCPHRRSSGISRPVCFRSRYRPGYIGRRLSTGGIVH